MGALSPSPSPSHQHRHGTKQGMALPAAWQVAPGSACSWTHRKPDAPTCGAGNPQKPLSHLTLASHHSPAHQRGPSSRHGHHTASSQGRSGWQHRSAGHTPAWGSSSLSHPRHLGTAAPHRSAPQPQCTWLHSHSGRPLVRQGALLSLLQAARVPRPSASPPPPRHRMAPHYSHRAWSVHPSAPRSQAR